MKAFFTMTWTEMKMSVRSFIYIFFTFIFPPMILLIFGGIYGNEPTEFYGGIGAVDYLTPAYIGMVLAVTAFMGLPIQLTDYRQNKILKRFKATPVSVGTIMVPHFIVNAVLCIFGTIFLLLAGKLAFNLSFQGNALLFILFFLFTLISMFSIGFLIASVSPSIKATNALSYLVYFPMLFLSGATIPLEAMPKLMIKISDFIPMTYAIKVLRGAWLGEPINDFLIPIVILSAVTLVCGGISLLTFKWE